MASVDKLLNDLESKQNAIVDNLNNENKSISENKINAATKLMNKENVTVRAEFPIEVFPDRIQNIIKCFHECYSLPVDYHAAGILAAGSAMIGNKYKIVLKKGFEVSPILWVALVGPPGIGKTPPINWSMQPIYNIDREMLDKKHLLQVELKKGYAEELAMAADPRKVQEPEEAVEKTIMLDDATMESIFDLHIKNPNGLVYVADEIMGWIESMDKYRVGGDQKRWLKIWDNNFIKINRSSKGSRFIPRSFIAVVGGVQPDLLQGFASGQKLADGFIARFLFVWPTQIEMPVWSEVEPDDSVFELYDNIMQFIHKMPSNLNDTTLSTERACFDAMKLYFSAEGKKEWIKFYNRVRVAEFNNTENVNLKAMLSKFDRHAAKFALILEVLDFACVNFDNILWQELSEEQQYTLVSQLRIGKKSMKNAVKLTEFFKRASFKIYDSLSSPVNTLKDYEQVWYNSLEEQFRSGEAVAFAKELKAKDPRFKLSRTNVFGLLRRTDLFRSSTGGRYQKLW